MNERRIRHFLKQTAISVSSLGNLFPAVATAPDEVAALVRRLHPSRPATGLIRVGPAGDGGYLLPDDLDGIQACFSPGVGNLTGFEEDCARLGMQVFMADGSIDPPPIAHPSMRFERKFIGAITDGDFVTLDDWVRAAIGDDRSDLLLQMDIEGYEYETLLSVPATLLSRFRVVAAEFHDLDQLWNRGFFRLASRAFDKLLRTHACVHIHPNNCVPPIRRRGLTIPPVMEFTFLRRDRTFAGALATEFPHPLDVENTPNPPCVLPACWYGNR